MTEHQAFALLTPFNLHTLLEPSSPSQTSSSPPNQPSLRPSATFRNTVAAPKMRGLMMRGQLSKVRPKQIFPIAKSFRTDLTQVVRRTVSFTSSTRSQPTSGKVPLVPVLATSV